MWLMRDQQMLEWFEAFDQTGPWQDLAIHALDTRDHDRDRYIGMIKIPHPGAGTDFLDHLITRIRGHVPARKIVRSAHQGRSMALFADNPQMLQGALQNAATALQYLGYRHPGRLADAPDNEMTPTFQADIDRYIQAYILQNTTGTGRGTVHSRTWMQESACLVAMGRIIGIPPFYPPNGALSHDAHRDPPLYRPPLQDLAAARDRALLFLRTLMRHIPAEAPPQQAHSKEVWRYCTDQIQTYLNQPDPMDKHADDRLFAACSTLCVMADGYPPTGPHTHRVLLTSLYITGYQEILRQRSLESPSVNA